MEEIIHSEHQPHQHHHRPYEDQHDYGPPVSASRIPNASNSRYGGSGYGSAPGGLEVLNGVDALFIKEEFNVGEVLGAIEMNNQYSVYNPMGVRIFYAGEMSGCCNRYCCGDRRPFRVSVYNCFGQHVLDVERKCNFALMYCGPKICGSNVTVTFRLTSEVLGKVTQNFSCTTPSFDVEDATGTKVMTIRGPCCAGCFKCIMCCDANFTIYDVLTGENVGTIMKKFSMKELVSDANDFGFNVRPGMDTKIKAVLLGAVFCIDFSYFEEDAKRGCNCKVNGIWITLILIVVLALVIVIAIAVTGGFE